MRHQSLRRIERTHRMNRLDAEGQIKSIPHILWRKLPLEIEHHRLGRQRFVRFAVGHQTDEALIQLAFVAAEFGNEGAFALMADQNASIDELPQGSAHRALAHAKHARKLDLVGEHFAGMPSAV